MQRFPWSASDYFLNVSDTIPIFCNSHFGFLEEPHAFPWSSTVTYLLASAARNPPFFSLWLFIVDVGNSGSLLMLLAFLFSVAESLLPLFGSISYGSSDWLEFVVFLHQPPKHFEYSIRLYCFCLGLFSLVYIKVFLLLYLIKILLPIFLYLKSLNGSFAISCYWLIDVHLLENT